MVDGIIFRPTTLTIASTLVALIVNTIFVLLNSLESICKFWVTAFSPKNIHSKQVANIIAWLSQMTTPINESRLKRIRYQIVQQVGSIKMIDNKQPEAELMKTQPANYK